MHGTMSLKYVGDSRLHVQRSELRTVQSLDSHCNNSAILAPDLNSLIY